MENKSFQIDANILASKKKSNRSINKKNSNRKPKKKNNFFLIVIIIFILTLIGLIFWIKNINNNLMSHLQITKNNPQFKLN